MKADSKTTKPAHKTKKKPRGPTFDAVDKAWQAAQAAWEALQTEKWAEGAAFHREVSRRHDARERASEKLAATPAQNVAQLAAKTAAYWRILTCDFHPPATATMQCVEEEHVTLLRAINKDAQRLAMPAASDPISAAATGADHDAIRRRLEMIQKVASVTGHCVITDLQIKKALNRRTSIPMCDFCERYGQSLDWVCMGDISGMIAKRIVDAGASVRGDA